jgi:hypothetical protein
MCQNDKESCTYDSDCCMEDSVCDDGVCLPILTPSVTDPSVSCDPDVLGKRCRDGRDCTSQGWLQECGYCRKNRPNDVYGTCSWKECGNQDDYCDRYTPCCEDLWCEQNTCTTHTMCRREGDPCDDAHVNMHCCEPDTVCLRNTCVKLPNCQREGEYCNKDRNLNCCTQLGLTCDRSNRCSQGQNTVDPPNNGGGAGSRCRKTAECRVGLNCRSNRCINLGNQSNNPPNPGNGGGVGSRCARTEDCDVGLNCRSNQCVNLGTQSNNPPNPGNGGGVGSRCARTEDCDVGLNCRSNQCIRVH